jgi:hypothetical protein
MRITARMWQIIDDLAADKTAAWQLVDGDLIRCGSDDGWHCPLSWLAKTTPGMISPAGRRLGLGMNEAYALANAADNKTIDVPFRQALLRACRLDPAGEGQ